MNIHNSDKPSEDAAQAGSGARFFGRRTTLRSPSEALHPETPPPPPLRPHSQRRPMLSAMSGFLSFLMIVAIGGVGILSMASNKLAQPGPLDTDKVVFIAPRTEVVEIIDQLAKAKVIDQPTLLKGALWVEGKWRKVRAGEYLFRKQASLNDVMETLVSGRQVLHSITIPEGLTSEQIVERLRKSDVLAGEINDIPPEGSLLPETYRVTRGMLRSALLRKMQDDQTRMLDRLWERRSAELPLRTKYEMVTLASIVEKETGRADERTRVAAVFFNRLRRGMKLQSDPTIVYGLVGGKGTLGRPIQRDEIRKPTKYNTYVIPALPPGPIANPGRASMEAVVNPSRTNDLFFVADGTGGHSFAESLEQHNRNVARWREIEREQKARAAAGQQPADGAPAVDANVDRVEDPAASEAAPAEPTPAPRRGRRGALAPDNGFGRVPGQISPGSTSIANLAKVLAQRASAIVPDARQPAAQPAIRSAPNALALARVNAGPAAPAGAAIAEAVKPAAKSSPYRIAPGLGELGIEIAGVGAPANASPIDGPVNEDDASPAAAGNLELFPLSPARRAEMNQRSKTFATGAAPTGAVAGAPQTIAPIPGGATPAPSATKVATRAPPRQRVIDASEGTKLDPLRNRSWDLNSAQTIPPLHAN